MDGASAGPNASFAQAARQVDNIPTASFQQLHDFITEFNSSVVLPLLLVNSRQSGQSLTGHQQPCIDRLNVIGLPVVIDILSKQNRRTVAEVVAFAKVWHQPNKAIPDELRPYTSEGVWKPLMEPREHKIERGLAQGWTVKCLNSGRELKQEGKALRHCVGEGAFAQRCLGGKCQILSIHDPDGHRVSTVQLGPDLEVIQHYGCDNTKAPATAQTALDEFLELVKKKKVPVNAHWGETQVSKEYNRRSALERAIGYTPTTEHIDRVVKHFQDTVTVKKSIAQKGKPTAGPPRMDFRLEGLVPEQWPGYTGLERPSGTEVIHHFSGPSIQRATEQLKSELSYTERVTHKRDEAVAQRT